MLLWCDVETTGLDATKGHLLEVAVVITDDQLVVLDSKEAVVRPVGVEVADLHLDDVVRKMHTDNGLLKDVEERGLRRYEAEELLVDKWLLPTYGVEVLRGMPLAGSTISFDRSWLAAHMPRILQLIHYRNVDVTTINELARRWAPDIYAKRPGQDHEAPHRAMADILGSIEVLRYYRNHLTWS
jgi:oligoribonuclease